MLIQDLKDLMVVLGRMLYKEKAFNLYQSSINKYKKLQINEVCPLKYSKAYLYK